MPIVLDTGPLVGLILPSDPHHRRAAALFEAVMDGSYGQALAPDWVYVECLNFLRAKARRSAVCEALVALFDDDVVRLVESGPAIRAAARRLYFDMFDRRLSMTDCGVIAHAEALGGAAVTVDSHWAGLVPLLDW